MNLSRTSIMHLIALLAVVCLLSSCAKEELVKPCGSEQQSPGDLRSASTHDQGGSSTSGFSTGNSGSDEETEDIGDDGDDLPDNERNRKKRLN